MRIDSAKPGRLWRDMSLRVKGLLVVFVLVLATVGAISSLVLVEFYEKSALTDIRHAVRLRNEVGAIQPLMSDAQTSSQIFALSGDLDTLSGYYRAYDALPLHISNLRSLLSDSPEQLERVQRIETASRRVLSLLEPTVVSPPSRLGTSLALIPFDEIDETLSELDADLAIIEQSASRTVSEAVAQRQQGRETLFIIVGVGAAIASGVGLVAVLLFLRSITSRIGRVEENARRIAQRQPLLPVGDGNDELGSLGKALIATNALLAERERELALASRVLEDRVQERTEELASASTALALEFEEHRKAEDALRQSEARFRSLVQNASDVVLILNPHGTIRYVSPSYERVLGGKAEERIGANAFANIHPDDMPKAKQAMESMMEDPTYSPKLVFRFLHPDGSWRFLEGTGANLLSEPSVGGIVVNIRDISERKLVEEQLARQAFSDSLTGLPNRALFVDRLAHALARTNRNSTRVAVLFIDMDRFKLVNDTLGHQTGDQLLIMIGKRLAACMRADDTLARFGGDEFTALLEGFSSPDEVTSLAERMLEACRTPLLIDGHEVFASLSIGIAVSDISHTSPDDLLRKADTALYRAKAGGRNCYVIHQPAMDAPMRQRLEIETDLRRALERQELCLYYQPAVRLKTGRIDEVEALARWQHPKQGLVLPGEFIPVAEETGLILPLGRWVLEAACRQAAEWQKQSPETPLVVAINLSGREFQQRDLAREIDRVLRSTGLDPSRLKLEITESILMDDVPATIRTLRKLKDLGVRLAIDDFGTGYSSMNYLLRFEVDTLKLDRSFVSGLTRDKRYRNMITTVAALARGLDMEVTVEGIETAEQLKYVREADVERGQGFYFAKPMPPERILGLLSVSPSSSEKSSTEILLQQT